MIDYIGPRDPPNTKITVREHSILLFGANKSEKKWVREMLLRLTPAMAKAVQSISVLRSCHQKEHFGFLDDDKNRPLIAHCHIKPRRRTCIIKSSLNMPILAHEAAHALTFKIQGGAPSYRRMLGEWKRVAQEYYAKNKFSKNQEFPCAGFLDDYSSRDVLEDIAMFIQYLHTTNLGPQNPFRKVKKITSVDTRYFRKLELLLKYKFIHQKDFNLIAPLLV